MQLIMSRRGFETRKGESCNLLICHRRAYYITNPVAFPNSCHDYGIQKDSILHATHHPGNESIGISVKELRLKELFTVLVTQPGDNKVCERSEHQQYLVKNLAVKTGDKVKVVWEANEQNYLGIQGKDFGYFPIAHTTR